MEKPTDACETTPEALVSELDRNLPSTSPKSPSESNGDASLECKPSPGRYREVFEAVEVLERDAIAIAESVHSLFSSLRLALSEVTGTSVEHMHCFLDAAGHLQEYALDAATKGNRYINSCLRLDQELKGINNLAMQIKILERHVDSLDSAVNRFLRLPSS